MLLVVVVVVGGNFLRNDGYVVVGNVVGNMVCNAVGNVVAGMVLLDGNVVIVDNIVIVGNVVVVGVVVFVVVVVVVVVVSQCCVPFSSASISPSIDDFAIFFFSFDSANAANTKSGNQSRGRPGHEN